MRGEPRRAAILLALIFGVFVTFLLHIGLGGSVRMSPWDVLAQLFAGPGVPGHDPANDIVWLIRLPRASAALLVGAILAGVGAAFQALFRNPLAEPYIIGVSSGAAVGGTLALLYGVASALAVMVWAVAGGLGSLALVLALAVRRGRLSVETLLLAGVVVGAMLAAVMTLNLLLAGEDSNRVLQWLLGSTSAASFERVAVLAAVLVVGTIVLQSQTRSLNAFAVGEFSSARLGVDTSRLKWTVLLTGTAMSAVAVGAVGIIGFLGLVGPHISRRVVGPDLRWSLVGAALVGGILLLTADVLAQRVRPGLDLPVGAVTAVLGAPALLWLLRRADR